MAHGAFAALKSKKDDATEAAKLQLRMAKEQKTGVGRDAAVDGAGRRWLPGLRPGRRPPGRPGGGPAVRPGGGRLHGRRRPGAGTVIDRGNPRQSAAVPTSRPSTRGWSSRSAGVRSVTAPGGRAAAWPVARPAWPPGAPAAAGRAVGTGMQIWGLFSRLPGWGKLLTLLGAVGVVGAEEVGPPQVLRRRRHGASRSALRWGPVHWTDPVGRLQGVRGRRAGTEPAGRDHRALARIDRRGRRTSRRNSSPRRRSRPTC